MGAGARAERTWNMPFMVVTLDVSKLSDWLNAVAYCRESKGGRGAGRAARAGRRQGVGRRRRKRLARGGPDSRLGDRARAERTWNMPFMVVTLEVSKLSGWLNAYASCRVDRRAHDMRGEVWPDRREGGG